MYKIKFSKQAAKDIKRIEAAGLLPKALVLIDIIKNNPYQNPPPYEKLTGYSSTYSRRIGRQHRLVYEICDGDNTLKIICLWTHYTNLMLLF